MSKSKMTDRDILELLVDKVDGLEKGQDRLEKKVTTNHKFLQANAKRTSEIDKKLNDHIKESKKNHNMTHKRIDTIGGDLAFLEDDAPTRDEFDDLEKRVTKIELKF